MAPLRKREIGTTVRRVEVVGSTMDAIREFDDDGTVLIADEQTQGRGRAGRTWLSPQGGLYVSFLLRPRRVDPSALGTVPLWTALAVAAFLADRGLEPHLSWPNDVLVGRAKISGVLSESTLQGSSVDRVICGVGLNVNNCTFPPDLPATSLRLELGKAQDLDVVLEDLLGRWTDRYNAWLDDPSACLAGYETCCTTLDHHVTAEVGTGRVQGLATGIGDHGELVIDTGQELVSVRAGDVHQLKEDPR